MPVIHHAFKCEHKGNCMSPKDFGKLVGCVLLCQIAGVIGALFTVRSIPTWYARLNKPWFNPPNQIFSPVWIVLYVLMGIALFLVWQKYEKAKDKSGAREAMQMFAVQLLLNSAWSIVFFGFQSPVAALIVVVLLWASIINTIMKFYKISKTAAYLLAPYIAWVTFAAVLNFFIIILN